MLTRDRLQRTPFEFPGCGGSDGGQGRELGRAAALASAEEEDGRCAEGLGSGGGGHRNGGGVSPRRDGGLAYVRPGLRYADVSLHMLWTGMGRGTYWWCG